MDTCPHHVGPREYRPFPPSSTGRYLPYSLEEGFSDVQRLAGERRSVTKVMSSSCSQPSPTKELSSSIRESTSDPSSAARSATSLLSRGTPNISPLGSWASMRPSL